MPSKKRSVNNRTKIKVLFRTEDLQLVEFSDRRERRRVWLPVDIPATMNECRGGIPAGIAAATLAPVLRDEAEGIAARLEAALHWRGLFAAADASRLPEAGRLVEAALAEAIKPLAALVLDIIRQEV